MVRDGPVDSPPDVPALAIAPSTVDFGSVGNQLTSAPAVLTITNIGGFPAGMITAALGGVDPGQFTAVASCGVLPAGTTCTVSVRFAPTSVGMKTAILTVGDGRVSATAALTGEGILVDNVATISPSVHDFGLWPIGATSTPAMFTITNIGGIPLGSPTIAFAGANPTDFAVESGTTCTSALAAGASCTIAVHYKPLAAGDASATLTYATNPGGTVSAGLTGSAPTGTALLPVAPGAGAFGDIAVGQTSAPVVFTLSNPSPWNTGAIATGIVGANPSDFAIVASTCTALAPGETCTVSVAFGPTATGARSATLSAKGAIGTFASPQLTGTGS